MKIFQIQIVSMWVLKTANSYKYVFMVLTEREPINHLTQCKRVTQKLVENTGMHSHQHSLFWLVHFPLCSARMTSIIKMWNEE